MSTKRHDRRSIEAAQYARGSDKPVAVPERILDAALAILAESGLRNLTQVQVANRARVRQSHLTYYIPTRDDLLDALGNLDVVGDEGDPSSRAPGCNLWRRDLRLLRLRDLRTMT